MSCLLLTMLLHMKILPLFAYSPQFIYYEHYVSILKNTLLAVGVAIIGMLFIALMFIPHPISITCVTLTMVTIVLGMFGFMHFWGLALSAITTVQIILSVGFCVDFTVHISHAFMTATGKNRNERVMAALEKVGVPILNGALSSILGILMLAFTSSYIFKSFFKTMMLVIVLGLAHSVLLLPVLLSFIGPRRTSKPRVFIPIAKPQDRPQTEEALRLKMEKQASLREEAAIEVERMRSMMGEDGLEHMEMKSLGSVAEEEEKLLDVPLDDGHSSIGSDRSQPLSHFGDIVDMLTHPHPDTLSSRSDTIPVTSSPHHVTSSSPHLTHHRVSVEPVKVPQIVLQAVETLQEPKPGVLLRKARSLDTDSYI